MTDVPKRTATIVASAVIEVGPNTPFLSRDNFSVLLTCQTIAGHEVWSLPKAIVAVEQIPHVALREALEREYSLVCTLADENNPARFPGTRPASVGIVRGVEHLGYRATLRQAIAPHRPRHRLSIHRWCAIREMRDKKSVTPSTLAFLRDLLDWDV